MAKILDLIYRVVDQASAPIRKIRGAQADFNSSTRAVKDALTGVGIAMAATGIAVAAAKKTWEATVGQLIDYNKQMGDASDSTGMAIDELSRFIQVGDDVGVSMGSITKALEMATKNGFAPSIASLADLADKGNAMSSETERAAFYAKIFGRNWAELNPILQMGKLRILELAKAQADGLVVTREELERTEKTRLAIDTLNDSYVAAKNELALYIDEHLNLSQNLGIANEVLKGNLSIWDANLHTVGILTQAMQDYYAVLGAAPTVPDVLRDPRLPPIQNQMEGWQVPGHGVSEVNPNAAGFTRPAPGTEGPGMSTVKLSTDSEVKVTAASMAPIVNSLADVTKSVHDMQLALVLEQQKQAKRITDAFARVMGIAN